MKTLAITFLVFLHTVLVAQKNIQSSNSFTIEGAVKKSLTVTLDSIRHHKAVSIDSVGIKNHLGERKSSLENITVIPLKIFLDQVEFVVESPKQLSEFYLVLEATDGYKVVFSWNEIFNNPLGETVYIVCSRDGKNIENLDNRIAVFSKTDQMTGRRYVKGLQKITVKRVE